MRLELEIDYEPDEDEAAQIRAARDAIERRRIVQGWLGFTRCDVQGVSVIDDGQEGPSGHKRPA
jgi:hypothetical protein